MQTQGLRRRIGVLARVGSRPFVAALALVVSLSLGFAEPAAEILAADQQQGDGGVEPKDFAAPGYRSTIVIVDNGPANPYGSTVTVSGLQGTVIDVNLTLRNFSHGRPSDVSIMLAHLGRAAVLMRDSSDGTTISNANIVLDNDAADPLPAPTPPPPTPPGTTVGPLVGGVAYQPFDFNPGVEFGGAAPDPNDSPPQQYLDFFQGLNPNGSWTLWVRDDLGSFTGSMGGWQLEIVTDNDLPYIAKDSYTAKQRRTLRVSASRGVLRNASIRGSDSLTAHKVSDPRKGKLVLHQDGSFEYTPKGNRRGSDSFEYFIANETGGSTVGNGIVDIKIKKHKKHKKHHKHKHNKKKRNRR